MEELEKDVLERRNKLEHYIKTLSNEIKARTTLITVLDQADAFYHNQRGEVKVVATAYRNYGNSIKTMKRKLEELSKTLPSPIPSPDINAPSPGPADNDFVLPGEKNFSQVSTLYTGCGHHRSSQTNNCDLFSFNFLQRRFSTRKLTE